MLAAYLPPNVSTPPEDEGYEDSVFTWIRSENIYQNERSGDCGPCAVKFIEMHAAGCSYQDMAQINDKMVDKFRQQYAMDTYEEFTGNPEVANQGQAEWL